MSEWIKWDGRADMPPRISETTRVDFRFRNGAQRKNSEAGQWTWVWKSFSLDWYDIVAYRLA